MQRHTYLNKVDEFLWLYKLSEIMTDRLEMVRKSMTREERDEANHIIHKSIKDRTD